MKKQTSLLAIIICVLCFQGILTTSAKNKTYNTYPYDYVASEIMHNKIVMLGENGALGHYNLFPHMTFLNIIKSWTSRAKEEKIQNKTLTLILEKSPSAIKLIKQYINSGDIMPFVNKHGDIYSLEDLYMYSKLKDLNREIEKSNNFLKIVGFEIDERYAAEWFFKKSDQERHGFGETERDSLLYVNIKAYIDANPRENILINYGSAHLNNEYFNGSSPENAKVQSNCMAVFLKREYGQKFITVDQTFIPDGEFIYGENIAYLKNKNFLVERNDTLFTNKIPFANLIADYTILRHDGLVGPHFLRNIFSQNTLLRDYNKLIEFKELSEKYNQNLSLKLSEVKNPIVKLTLESIELITGREFNSVNEYKSYLDSTEKIFHHDRIINEELSVQLLSELKKYSQDQKQAQEFRYTLYCLGLPSSFLFTQGVPPEKVWKDDLWKKACPNMNYFDYVGLLWLGNLSEKEKAKEFLLRFTKNDYAEASDYLAWYYKEYYNYDMDWSL